MYRQRNTRILTELINTMKQKIISEKDTKTQQTDPSRIFYLYSVVLLLHISHKLCILTISYYAATTACSLEIFLLVVAISAKATCEKYVMGIFVYHI